MSHVFESQSGWVREIIFERKYPNWKWMVERALNVFEPPEEPLLFWRLHELSFSCADFSSNSKKKLFLSHNSHCWKRRRNKGDEMRTFSTAVILGRAVVGLVVHFCWHPSHTVSLCSAAAVCCCCSFPLHPLLAFLRCSTRLPSFYYFPLSVFIFFLRCVCCSHLLRSTMMSALKLSAHIKAARQNSMIFFWTVISYFCSYKRATTAVRWV